jgi:hypothetical protein
MKEIKEIKKNYEMGFISSQEFLCEYAGVMESHPHDVTITSESPNYSRPE